MSIFKSAEERSRDRRMQLHGLREELASVEQMIAETMQEITVLRNEMGLRNELAQAKHEASPTDEASNTQFSPIAYAECSAPGVDPHAKLRAAVASLEEYDDEMFAKLFGPPLDERTWSADESDAFFQGLCARALARDLPAI